MNESLTQIADDKAHLTRPQYRCAAVVDSLTCTLTTRAGSGNEFGLTYVRLLTGRKDCSKTGWRGTANPAGDLKCDTYWE